MNKNPVYIVLKIFSNVIFRGFFRLKVLGVENVPRKGGFLLAANHLSYLDPIAIGVASPRQLNYMARHDLFENFFSSGVLKCCGVFPVKRDSADFGALKEAMRRVKKGMGLLLFPEGTRQIKGKFGQPQPGVGFLAGKLKVPVIPVFVSGTEQVLPKGVKFIKPAVISVRFGKQILIERRMPYQDIAIKIMESIRHLSCEALN